MNAIARLFRKLGFLTRREKFDADLEEEMRFHREQQARELQADGMTREAAQHAARRQFGNDTHLHEQSREVVSFRAESVVQDSRFALRQLRKNPGFAITAVLMLTLGIAACVALFAFVDSALIKPLPYKDPVAPGRRLRKRPGLSPLQPFLGGLPRLEEDAEGVLVI